MFSGGKGKKRRSFFPTSFDMKSKPNDVSLNNLLHWRSGSLEGDSVVDGKIMME